MKKTYITPATELITLNIETPLMDLSYKGGEDTDFGDGLTNGRDFDDTWDE